MNHSLPGFNLIYLPEDNLAPEEYERIISPFFAWSHFEGKYDFDDGYYLIFIVGNTVIICLVLRLMVIQILSGLILMSM